MSVYKTERSPYFHFDFQYRSKRFHGSTGCTTRRDAERYEQKLRTRIALGDEEKLPITVDGACDLYWEAKGKHQKTAATTEYQLANLCTMLGSTKALSDIATKDFQSFVAKRRGTVSPASVNREVQLARRVWKYARSAGFAVPSIESKAVDWGELMLPEPQERVRELSADEERRLFAALPADIARVVEFAILSGQRRASVIGLLRAKVDLDGRRATVTMKGDKEHTFPITPRMIAIIKAAPVVAGCPYVFTYECERPTPPRRDRKPEAVRVKGQRYPFTLQGWKRKWEKALEAAGIEDFRFHDLRHTTATRLLRSSGNLKAAQQLLGHTDIATTARYAHVIEDDLRAAMTGGRSRNSTEEGLTATEKASRINGHGGLE